jgi:hypothetical protein
MPTRREETPKSVAATALRPGRTSLSELPAIYKTAEANKKDKHRSSPACSLSLAGAPTVEDAQIAMFSEEHLRGVEAQKRVPSAHPLYVGSRARRDAQDRSLARRARAAGTGARDPAFVPPESPRDRVPVFCSLEGVRPHEEERLVGLSCVEVTAGRPAISPVVTDWTPVRTPSPAAPPLPVQAPLNSANAVVGSKPNTVLSPGPYGETTRPV